MSSCVVGGLAFNVTTWASLVLRFLSTCGSYPHELLLLAGLIEFEPPSVKATLEHVGLDGRTLRTGVEELRIRMTPARSNHEDPFFQDAQHRYFTWQHSPGGLSEPMPRFVLPRTSDELVSHMLAWLSDEYQEVPTQADYQKGDIVLFTQDRLQDLCVLGAGRVWHSLTGRTSGGTMASCGKAARIFRAE